MTAAKLQKRVQDKKLEAQRLEKLIRQRVSARQLSGLQTEVDKFLALSPKHAEMLKLKQQLHDREAKLISTREAAYAAAKALMTARDYQGAVTELARIAPAVMQPEIEQLKQQATENWTRLQALQKSIASAVEQKRYHGLLLEVEELLKLKPDDAAMMSLQSQLIAREEKNAAQIEQIVLRAQKLRQNCRFQQAQQELSRIPKELQTQESLQLLENCEFLDFERNSAMAALANGLKSQQFQPVISSAQNYHSSLLSEWLTDTEFQSQLQAYNQLMANLQAKKAAEERNQKIMKRVAIGAVTIALLAMLVGAGVWVGSVIRGSALASAIQNQTWDYALSIDPNNVTALIGRVNDRLKQATPDIEEVFEDLLRIEQIDTNLQELKPVKEKAYALRAEKRAELGQLNEAESDYVIATNLGANSEILQTARQNIALAYMKKAEEAAISGELAQVAPNVAKAFEYDRSVEATPAILDPFANTAINAFEQSDSDQNLNAAMAAIEKLKAVKPGNDNIEKYKQSIAVILISRARKTSASDPRRVLSDIVLAEELGATATDLVSLKTELSQLLLARCRQLLSSKEFENALGDYIVLSSADPQTARQINAEISSQVPAEVYLKLPTEILATLPTEILATLPSHRLFQLPPKIILRVPPYRNSIGMEFKLLPAGRFMMGDVHGGSSATPHQVTLTKAYSLGVHEVTQEQYERVMGKNPSKFKGARNPVEGVSWEDAVEFCRKLSALPAEKTAGRVYRLPTEAEWEYACRSGKTTKYGFGDSESELENFAWFDNNSGQTTHPVGQKKPNAWGLHDMHGNLYEWCSDWYGDYPRGAVTDPTGPSGGSLRVYRGGSWRGEAADCRSARRLGIAPSYRGNLGFRLALSSPEIPK
jgi:formylglycine-generating enzyme required for sulfatase activity